MKFKIAEIKEVEVTQLKVRAGVRYWEDATVDGKEDTEGELIPCRDGENWEPIIDLYTGIIKNWESGVEADIHYKVCDDGDYYLLDANGNEVVHIDGYVPNMMSPKDQGYGDYIIMEVDCEGAIKDWKVDFTDFSGIEQNA